MYSSTTQSALDTFNDFVGAFVPGTILITGSALAVDISPTAQHFDVLAGPAWLVYVAVAFAAGHATLGVNAILRSARSRIPSNSCLHWLRPNDVRTVISQELAYLTISDYIQNSLQPHNSIFSHADGDSPPPFNTVRNIAMSLDREAGEMGRRFMFIALSCSGVATSLLLVIIVWIIAGDFALLNSDHALLLGAALLSVFALYRRATDFERRAVRTPFDIAASRLIFQHSEKGELSN